MYDTWWEEMVTELHYTMMFWSVTDDTTDGCMVVSQRCHNPLRLCKSLCHVHTMVVLANHVFLRMCSHC
jgi:hypothetical protein